MSDYISECRFVPIEENPCSQNNWSIESLKVEISKGKQLVKVLIWNPNVEIIEVLSTSNYRSKFLSKYREVILFIHDMGESAYSERMRNLIRKSYVKKPEALVISLDYSLVAVSYTHLTLPTILLV